MSTAKRFMGGKSRTEGRGSEKPRIRGNVNASDFFLNV